MDGRRRADCGDRGQREPGAAGAASRADPSITPTFVTAVRPTRPVATTSSSSIDGCRPTRRRGRRCTSRRPSAPWLGTAGATRCAALGRRPAIIRSCDGVDPLTLDIKRAHALRGRPLVPVARSATGHAARVGARRAGSPRRRARLRVRAIRISRSRARFRCSSATRSTGSRVRPLGDAGSPDLSSCRRARRA